MDVNLKDMKFWLYLINMTIINKESFNMNHYVIDSNN